MSSSSSNAKAKIAKQREKLRNQVSAEEDDPLAPYERYVTWLFEQSEDDPGTYDLEILVSLEEALRKFRDDRGYRDDLRYAKLWLAYAQRVEKPDLIYVYMLKSGMGTIHAQLYDDYALSLETQNRFREAEEAYRLGISRSNRGADRLKKRCKEFQQRVSSNATLSSMGKPPYIPPEEAASTGAKLYRNPLRNIVTKRSSSGTKPKPSTSSSAGPQAPPKEPLRTDGDPYAHMKAVVNAASVAGKKAEKYRFDLSLLFKDGNEYCIQEARAASLGLLGKTWGPPPRSEAGPSKAKGLRFETNDEGTRPSTRTNKFRMNTDVTGHLATEPTVTLNTKEALKDVFGMYNSPEKSVKMSRIVPGSKHAPVRKLEPLLASQSRNNLRKITEDSAEDGKPLAKAAAFRPFVDEENKKENAPVPKFKPFVDENASNATPRATLGPRRALAAKETVPVAEPTARSQESDNDIASPMDEDRPPPPVFSKVFTPLVDKRQTSNQTNVSMQVFRDSNSQPSVPPPSGGVFSSIFSRPQETPTTSQAKAPLRSESVFTPAQSSNKSENAAEPVFRRNVFTPQHSTFTPLSRSRQPLSFTAQRPLTQNVVEREPEPEPESTSEPEADFEGSGSSADEYMENEQIEEEYMEGEGDPGQYYTDEDADDAPLGGRFGRFDVMTPIAERTFECTMTTRTMLGTPSKSNGNANALENALVNNERAAAVAAEKLARELQEEVEVQSEDVDEEMGDPDSAEDDDDDDLVERTGTLSLADAIAVASSFKPSNPCNPADPKIVNTLLSLIPPEPDFFDLRTEDSGHFDDLQKFAKKKARKSTSAYDDILLRLDLHDRRFAVSDILGEGGFGVVFKAREGKVGFESDDDEDIDMDEDEDDEDNKYLALKVVKPRNLWEFHVLRRIHSSLPSIIRTSFVEARGLYVYRDESYLLLDLCNQGTLLDIVNHAADAGVSQQGACLDELLVVFFSIELLKLVESLHKTGFIHGDLKVDNCLLRLEDVPGGPNAWSGMYQTSGEGGWRQKGIKMVDFGRTIDTRMYPSGQRFVADWKTSDCESLDLCEKRPWTYDIDYFGLASIIYCMLFGKHFDSESVTPISDDDGRLKLSAPFKRYWQADLWTRVFDTLLNPNDVREDGSLPLLPELASLRQEMEVWLESNCNRSSNTLKGLLKKVERFVLSSSR